MACLEMYNNNSTADTNSTASAANYFSTAPPRISFSTDFADSSSHTIPKSPLGTSSSSSSSAAAAAAASSLDFEFSVGNHSMSAADELFFQGQMLPFKDGGARKPTTLREELLAGDEDDDGGVSLRPPKGPTRWKGFLGLRKTHIGSSSKKPDPKLPPSVAAAADQDAAMHND